MKKILENIKSWLVGNSCIAHYIASTLLCLYISIYDLATAIFLPLFFVFAKEVSLAVVVHRDGDNPDKIKWSDILGSVIGVLLTALPLYFIINR